MTRLGIATFSENADRHDRRHAQVAQDGVEIGAAHRAEAVPSGQDEIAWCEVNFGQQRRAGASWRDVYSLARPGEQPRIVVRTESVGPSLHQAVHDAHARGASRRKQSHDVRERFAAGLGGQHRQAGIGPHHRALHLLGDQRGMCGSDELAEIGLHQPVASSGGLVGEALENRVTFTGTCPPTLALLL
jgi:hypothetical protein